MKEVGEGTPKDIIIYALEFWFNMTEFGNKHHQLTQMSWVSNRSYHICFGLLATSFTFREGVGLEDNTDLHFAERKAAGGGVGGGCGQYNCSYSICKGAKESNGEHT